MLVQRKSTGNKIMDITIYDRKFNRNWLNMNEERLL